jgi:hypothetical protein
MPLTGTEPWRLLGSTCDAFAECEDGSEIGLPRDRDNGIGVLVEPYAPLTEETEK